MPLSGDIFSEPGRPGWGQGGADREPGLSRAGQNKDDSHDCDIAWSGFPTKPRNNVATNKRAGPTSFPSGAWQPPVSGLGAERTGTASRERLWEPVVCLGPARPAYPPRPMPARPSVFSILWNTIKPPTLSQRNPSAAHSWFQGLESTGRRCSAKMAAKMASFLLAMGCGDPWPFTEQRPGEGCVRLDHTTRGPSLGAHHLVLFIIPGGETDSQGDYWLT